MVERPDLRPKTFINKDRPGFCPICGGLIAQDRADGDQCPTCFTRLFFAPSPAQQEAKPTFATLSDPSLYFYKCPKCGELKGEPRSHCLHCGASLPRSDFPDVIEEETSLDRRKVLFNGEEYEVSEEGGKYFLRKNPTDAPDEIKKGKLEQMIRDRKVSIVPALDLETPGTPDVEKGIEEERGKLLEVLRKRRDVLSAEIAATPASPVAPRENISRSAEILDGAGTESLVESMREYESAGGDLVLAGTNKGIGYKKHNEDRVGIFPDSDLYVVIDGLGSPSGGEAAAQTLAEGFLASPESVYLAIKQSREKMAEKELAGKAVFMSVRIQPIDPTHKSINYRGAGDCGLIVIKKNGEVAFKSKDNSFLQKLVDSTPAGSIGMTADEALYTDHIYRNIVYGEISASPEEVGSEPETHDQALIVEEGDLVILKTDGLKFTAEEIAEKVKAGFSERELFAWCSDESARRMRDKKKIIGAPNEDGTESEEQKDILKKRKETGVYPDGFKYKPGSDNLSLVLIKIKGESGNAEPAGETGATDTIPSWDQLPVLGKEGQPDEEAERRGRELRDFLANDGLFDPEPASGDVERPASGKIPTVHVIEVRPEVRVPEAVVVDITPEETKRAAIIKLQATLEANERIITAATRRMEELQKVIASEAKEDRLFELKRKQKEAWFKGKYEKEIRKLGLEIDKEKNPFKYFLIDQLSDENFQVLFLTSRENVTVEAINTFGGRAEDYDPTGEECAIYATRAITSDKDHIMFFSTNGFYAKLSNPIEMRGRREDDIDARYEIVNPYNSRHDLSLTHAEAKAVLEREAKKYQAQLLANFERLKSRNGVNY